MKILKTIVAGVVMMMVMAGSVMADNFEKRLKKEPGYVDFGAIEFFESEEARIEVYLKEPMLKLIGKFMKTDDPEMFDIMNKLLLVRVQVFDINRSVAGKLAEISSVTAKRLDGEGWDRLVRVREQDEHIDVYLKPSEDYNTVKGIVVMVINDNDEAIFVNIVGDINPDDISKLGGQFDIDELEGIQYRAKKKNRDDG